jgi:hypothetical protein
MAAKQFPIARTEPVITSSYVTQAGQPILYVSHDPDDESASGGAWQFHCGNGDYAMDRMQLVALDTILAIDPSVAEVADMAVGYGARRTEPGAAWQIAAE